MSISVFLDGPWKSYGHEKFLFLRKVYFIYPYLSPHQVSELNRLKLIWMKAGQGIRLISIVTSGYNMARKKGGVGEWNGWSLSGWIECCKRCLVDWLLWIRFIYDYKFYPGETFVFLLSLGGSFLGSLWFYIFQFWTSYY